MWDFKSDSHPRENQSTKQSLNISGNGLAKVYHILNPISTLDDVASSYENSIKLECIKYLVSVELDVGLKKSYFPDSYGCA